MKAYLIDPEARSITEVDYSGNYQHIYDLIGADAFDCARLYPNGDAAFIDDEGLFKDPKFFWLHRYYGGPIAGRGLVLGCDGDGESVSPQVQLSDLRNDVMFVTDEQLRDWIGLAEVVAE